MGVTVLQEHREAGICLHYSCLEKGMIEMCCCPFVVPKSEPPKKKTILTWMSESERHVHGEMERLIVLQTKNEHEASTLKRS